MFWQRPRKSIVGWWSLKYFEVGDKFVHARTIDKHFLLQFRSDDSVEVHVDQHRRTIPYAVDRQYLHMPINSTNGDLVRFSFPSDSTLRLDFEYSGETSWMEFTRLMVAPLP